MLKPLTLVAVLLATTAPMAHAQDYDDDNGDRVERTDRDEARDEDRADPPARDMRRGDRWARDRDDREEDRGLHEGGRNEDGEHGKRDDREARRDDDRGPGMRGHNRGPGDRRGPPPPPPRAGFEIRLGPGQSIRVDCGDEDIASCVEAARPIVDSARDLARPGPGGPDGPVSRVPPPPADLVNPDSGADAPPPPAGDTPPPPPPAN